MADLTNQYTPREMIDALVQAPRPTTFLLDRLVGRTTEHTSKYIEIDIDKRGESISPYVSRVGDPTPVGKDGFTNLIHLAPYLYDEVILTPSDGDVRTPGNTIYQSPAAANVDKRVADALAELVDRMIRREEQQLAEALRTGKQVIQGDGVDYTVDYQMDASHIITLAGADLWDSGTEDKIKQFEDWSTLIMDTGAPAPRECYMALDTAQSFLKDTAILSLLDNRRVERGEINFRQLNEQRATFIGTLMGNGLNIDCYSYQGSYLPDGGSRTRYIPSKYLILTSPETRIEKHYSKIENFNADFVGERFPMDVIEANGKRRFITMESGPLVALHQPDGVVSVKVKA